MCFLFHKWSKWSEPVRETWEEKTFYHGTLVSNQLFIRIKQERTCLRCGKHKVAYKEEE